jgi:hypothetical protein
MLIGLLMVDKNPLDKAKFVMGAFLFLLVLRFALLWLYHVLYVTRGQGDTHE